MATDPNLLLPENEPELGLGEDAMVLEPPVAEGPEVEETQVAGVFSGLSRMTSAISKTTDDIVPPKQDVPPSELIDGNIIINPIDPAIGVKFRELLGVGPDTPIRVPMPNLRQMNLEDSHKQYVETLHRLWDEDIAVGKRHTRTMDQIIEDAQSIGWDEAAIQLLKRKKGEAFNDVEMARSVWVRLNAMHHLDEIMKDITSGGGKYDDADLLQFLPLAGAIEIQTTGAIAEAGRAMAVFAEAFINAFLSGPVTHAVNISGNTVFGAIQVPERLGAGAIGSVRTNIFKGLGGDERVQMSEAWSMLQSLGRGLQIGMKAAHKALIKEEGSFGRGASKIDNRVDKAISSEYLNIKNNAVAMAVDAYGVMVRALGSRMLLVEDEFAKGVFYRMELEALANRRMTELVNNGMSQEDAVIEGARILAGHDATIVKSAEDFAVKTTFQGDLGPIARWAQGGFSHPLMKIFVPFFKTPMNIVAETLERSPLAGITPGFWTDMRAGGAKADLAMSKFMLGSSAFAMTAMYATGEVIPDFKITGMGPEDKNARRAWRRNGLEPYSFAFRGKDGKWTSWQYGRLAPIAGILAMSSDYSEFSQYEDDQDKLTRLTIDAGASLYEQLKQLPMLQGVFEIAEVAGKEFETGRDKARRFGEMITEKFAGALMTASPGFTGSLSATIERVMDERASNVKPTTEQTENAFYTSPVARGWFKALNRMKSRNPFYSDEVPEKLNLWGETMKQCQNGLWCFISPIRVIDSKNNAVDKEMVDLGLGLRMPGTTQRGIKLTSDQYNDMIIDMNLYDYGNSQTMVQEMGELIKQTWYLELEPGERLEQLRNIMGDRKDLVLDSMFTPGSVLKNKEDFRKVLIKEGRKPLQ